MKIFYNNSQYYDNKELRKVISTIYCECGNDRLFINFIPAPFSGCYLKLTCPECMSDEIIYDDYS